MSVRSDIGPFAIVPEWLIYSGVSSNAIRLFAVLHRHDGAGGCHPGRKRLATLMACSESTVDRTIRELSDAGAVTVEAQFDESGDRSSNSYLLHFSSPQMRGGVTGAATGGVIDAATGGVTGDEVTKAHRNESPLNERRASAPTPLLPMEERKPAHKPITERFLLELQARNPDMDVKAVYVKVQNLRRWDGYKDKRRGLMAELGYERERKARFQPETKHAGELAWYEEASS